MYIYIYIHIVFFNSSLGSNKFSRKMQACRKTHAKEEPRGSGYDHFSRRSKFNTEVTTMMKISVSSKFSSTRK